MVVLFINVVLAVNLSEELDKVLKQPLVYQLGLTVGVKIALEFELRAEVCEIKSFNISRLVVLFQSHHR